MASSGKCCVPICDRQVGDKGARGMCSTHYKRWKARGDAEIDRPIMPRQPLGEACSIDGCDAPPHGMGMCSKHYMRFRSHGDPSVVKTGGRTKADPLDRIRKTENCWHWTGYIDKNGYGWLSGVPAHRLIYEALVGPIPDGHQIDHLCRTHDCVRPEHLEPVPQPVNIARGTGFSARNAVKTHCPAGHAYDLANTYRSPGKGERRCRRCAAIRQQQRSAAKRARKAA